MVYYDSWGIVSNLRRAKYLRGVRGPSESKWNGRDHEPKWFALKIWFHFILMAKICAFILEPRIRLCYKLYNVHHWKWVLFLDWWLNELYCVKPARDYLKHPRVYNNRILGYLNRISARQKELFVIKVGCVQESIAYMNILPITRVTTIEWSRSNIAHYFHTGLKVTFYSHTKKEKFYASKLFTLHSVCSSMPRIWS